MSRTMHRSPAPELMDDFHCSGTTVEQTLRELDFINRHLGGNRITLQAVFKLMPEQVAAGRVLHLADLGCGSGDMLRRIARRARRLGLPLRLTGFDANPFIVEFARVRSGDFPEIDYRVADVRSEEFRSEQFDIITCTLFLHHFSDEELSDMLTGLRRQARIGLVVNDLHRHWLAFHAIRILTRLFSRSSMVRYDAPLSVLRSFVRSDWKAYLQKAGIGRYHLRWRWAFRWQLIVKSPQQG